MLNREERRKLKKIFYLEDDDIERIKNDILYKATNEAFQLFMLTAVFALRDEFGFGNNRIDRFIDAVSRKVDEYNEGCFTLADMKKAMQIEVGYEDKKIAELKRAVE